LEPLKLDTSVKPSRVSQRLLITYRALVVCFRLTATDERRDYLSRDHRSFVRG